MGIELTSVIETVIKGTSAACTNMKGIRMIESSNISTWELRTTKVRKRKMIHVGQILLGLVKCKGIQFLP